MSDRKNWLEVPEHQAIRALIERARFVAAELVAAADAAEVAQLRIIAREVATLK